MSAARSAPSPFQAPRASFKKEEGKGEENGTQLFPRSLPKGMRIPFANGPQMAPPGRWIG
jgi:hypothetical protein